MSKVKYIYKLHITDIEGGSYQYFTSDKKYTYDEFNEIVSTACADIALKMNDDWWSMLLDAITIYLTSKHGFSIMESRQEIFLKDSFRLSGKAKTKFEQLILTKYKQLKHDRPKQTSEE